MTNIRLSSTVSELPAIFWSGRAEMRFFAARALHRVTVLLLTSSDEIEPDAGFLLTFSAILFLLCTNSEVVNFARVARHQGRRRGIIAFTRVGSIRC